MNEENILWIHANFGAAILALRENFHKILRTQAFEDATRTSEIRANYSNIQGRYWLITI